MDEPKEEDVEVLVVVGGEEREEEGEGEEEEEGVSHLHKCLPVKKDVYAVSLRLDRYEPMYSCFGRVPSFGEDEYSTRRSLLLRG